MHLHFNAFALQDICAFRLFSTSLRDIYPKGHLPKLLISDGRFFSFSNILICRFTNAGTDERTHKRLLLYTSGRKVLYPYEAIFLVKKSLNACISHDLGWNFTSFEINSIQDHKSARPLNFCLLRK